MKAILILQILLFYIFIHFLNFSFVESFKVYEKQKTIAEDKIKNIAERDEFYDNSDLLKIQKKKENIGTLGYEIKEKDQQNSKFKNDLLELVKNNSIEVEEKEKSTDNVLTNINDSVVEEDLGIKEETRKDDTDIYKNNNNILSDVGILNIIGEEGAKEDAKEENSDSLNALGDENRKEKEVEENDKAFYVVNDKAFYVVNDKTAKEGAKEEEYYKENNDHDGLNFLDGIITEKEEKEKERKEDGKERKESVSNNDGMSANNLSDENEPEEKINEEKNEDAKDMSLALLNSSKGFISGSFHKSDNIGKVFIGSQNRKDNNIYNANVHKQIKPLNNLIERDSSYNNNQRNSLKMNSNAFSAGGNSMQKDKTSFFRNLSNSQGNRNKITSLNMQNDIKHNEINQNCNKKIKIGINGFGRIGRLVLRSAIQNPIFDVNHINCSMSPEYMCYLLKYDSAHGTLNLDIKHTAETLIVNGKEISVSHTRKPEEIPWSTAGNVEYVCESTGAFCTTKQALLHIEREGGCRRVVISAPAKDEETPMFVIGVNSNEYNPKMSVVSCASCTTNALAPLVKVLHDNFVFEEGLMSTIHAATNTQNVVDSNSKKDWRGGRSALVNIIPSSTGAAKAVCRVLPELKGKITGMSFRVPTINVSVVDLTFRVKKKTTYEEIKDVMKRAAAGDLQNILGYTEESVVSQDFIGNKNSSIFDSAAGLMLNNNFFKVVSWYDNEYGYANRVLDMFRIMHEQDCNS